MSDDLDISAQLDNIDLSTVSTSFPMLAAGLQEVNVAEVKIEPQKAPKTGKNLKIKLTLVNPAVDIEGKTVNAGFPLFDTVSLTKTFKDDGSVKYDPTPKLALFKEVVTGSKDGTFMPLEQYIGKSCLVQVSFVPAQGEFGPQNRIQRYVKPSA